MALYELLPGDVTLGRAGDQLKTLLGSCVSVILTDRPRTIGVMSHIVHVGHPNAANHHNTAYGSVAMAEMVRLLYSVGFTPRSCEAYVFGGGNMFPKLFSHHHVGSNNVDWVLGYLEHHKIPVLQHDLGGHGYRKLLWTVGPSEPIVETVLSD
ncbi:chemotaxis protein CheD [Candidatus Symbiobacter mobilis]|uniref:Chemotaxis methyltransferase protein n=1 Tax=Candidatus Symbiobacter mobilis CR TaxID=946483 RepID=U5N8E9_9BURK|nr:chemotaxis protein CheD [Candidatus Symbiobacter mobilis]AGX87590.1 chemotaxis methyltransferase protein [Candidatus Symbiobacter mobilis CR]